MEFSMVNINSLERDWLHQAEFYPRNIIDNRPSDTLVPDRSQPGLTMTAPSGHWGLSDKYSTGVTNVKKIRGRENMSIGIWNMRTLKP